MYGDEYPAITRLPNSIIGEHHVIEQDGVEIVVESVGVGEAPDASILYIPASGNLILSDVLYVKTHAWLVEQHSRQWIAQLDHVKRTYTEARMVYSGHGECGDCSCWTT